MQIKFTWPYCLGLLAFIFVFGQLHEVAHLVTALLVCGCPGKQDDFNLWTTCAACVNSPHEYFATIAGPVFSYCMMWLGFYWLYTLNNKLWFAGFVMVLGNLPFARMLTAAMGGGDETTVLKIVLSSQFSPPVIKIIGFLLVFALSFPPLAIAFIRLKNKYRFWLIAALSILPLFIMMGYEFKLLKLVISAGFLSQTHFLGIADFIYLHTFLMGIVVISFRKSLFTNPAY
jgi:hypothetical protein